MEETWPCGPTWQRVGQNQQEAGVPGPGATSPRLDTPAPPPTTAPQSRWGAGNYGVGRAAGAGAGFRGSFSSRCAACHAKAASTAAFHFMSSGWIFS